VSYGVSNTPPEERNVISYHSYVEGRDTHCSYYSLEEAIVGAITYKFEGPNAQTDQYFVKMVGLPNSYKKYRKS